MFKDITGQKFNRLTVIERKGHDKHKSAIWLCECICGNRIIASTNSLRRNNTKSCGCLQKEKAKNTLLKFSFKHGLSRDENGKKTRLFRIWTGIKTRCLNGKVKEYPKYGGRGITICDEWLKDFKVFYDWSLLNNYSDDLSIDRKDNDGNYEPNNCRWTNSRVQANNRTSNSLLAFKGETKTLAEWVLEYNITYGAAFERLKRGWSLEKSLITPVKN